MNAKSIGTVVLLSFVAVSLGYLIISELNTGDAGGDTASAREAPQDAPERQMAGASAEAPATIGNDPAPSAPVAGPAKTPHKVVAYYFHNTQRCMTCRKIERLAEEALREQFSAAFEDGALEWRVLNMEDPPNAHFVQDYQLVTSSLVLVDLHDGKQRDWTNMEKVWQYVHDDEAEFKRYVAEQAREYLES
jgi:hypothetical protein